MQYFFKEHPFVPNIKTVQIYDKDGKFIDDPYKGNGETYGSCDPELDAIKLDL